MTERRTADTINDDELDQLYADLDHYEEHVVGDLNEKNISLARRAERAEATLARVRALRDDLRATTGARYIADALDTILDGKPPPAHPRPACRYCPDPRCPESCPECGSLIHDLDAVPPPPACSSACSEGHTYGFRCEQQRPPTPAPPVPCPVCRRADQAGLAAAEQHDDCAKEQPGV